MGECFVMPSVGILIHCSGGGQLGSEWKSQMSVKLRGNDSHTLTPSLGPKGQSGLQGGLSPLCMFVDIAVWYSWVGGAGCVPPRHLEQTSQLICVNTANTMP